MKKTVHFLLLAIMVGTISFVGCKKDDPDDPNPTPTTPTFTFNKSGNEWHMAFNYITTNDTMIIKLGQNLGNNKFEFITWQKGDELNKDTSYMYISSTELAELDSADVKYTWLKSTAKVGDVYWYVEGTDTIKYTVQSINTNVAVPVGTFSCYKVKQTMNSETDGMTLYINKDKGFIKIEFPVSPGVTVSGVLIYKNF